MKTVTLQVGQQHPLCHAEAVSCIKDKWPGKVIWADPRQDVAYQWPPETTYWRGEPEVMTSEKKFDMHGCEGAVNSPYDVHGRTNVAWAWMRKSD